MMVMTRDQISAGDLVYVSEGPLTDKPDMKLAPGRLLKLEQSGPGFPEAHGVVERLCLDIKTHLDTHEKHCKQIMNADLIRSAGKVITDVICYATLQYTSGTHETKECVVWTSKGLCLLGIDEKTRRYEWRFGPKPIKDGRPQDRRPLTIGGHPRKGDFVVQRLDREPSANSWTGYWDVEGDWAHFLSRLKSQTVFKGMRR